MSKLGGQLLRFGVAGVAGLAVDVLVLQLALVAGLGWTLGRLLSFLCAVYATWQINRRFTFESAGHSLWTEWWRYLAAMSGGGAVNLAVYALVVWLAPPLSQQLLGVLAVAAGSLAGMTVNFVGARWFVFKR